MKISKRLETICNFVTPGVGVADVGADHGLVEKYLLNHYISTYIVAIENKKGPYQILKNSLKDFKEVRLSLSDGISDIDNKVSTVIIAGMGGINIVEILKKDIKKLNKVDQIIIDAHRDTYLVRKEIVNLGYKIEKEDIIFEQNKFYNIISFSKGFAKYSKTQLEWGYKVEKLDLFESYKEHELLVLKKRLSALEKSPNSSLDEISELKNKIERLEKYGN